MMLVEQTTISVAFLKGRVRRVRNLTVKNQGKVQLASLQWSHSVFPKANVHKCCSKLSAVQPKHNNTTRLDQLMRNTASRDQSLRPRNRLLRGPRTHLCIQAIKDITHLFDPAASPLRLYWSLFDADLFWLGISPHPPPTHPPSIESTS